MPLLSAAANLTYPDNTKFKPITTLTGNAVPDYGLDFDISTNYRGDEYAFDSCDDPSLLVSREIIEEDFFVCSYERLFKYKTNTPTPIYYLVPWMGVPATNIGVGTWQPLDNIYVLKVKLVRFTKALRQSDVNARKRTLRLVSSNTLTTAGWNSSQSTDLVVNDITAMSQQAISVAINDGTHNETGEYIEIKEVLANGSFGKTVGKLRILFLKMLTQKIFLINVTESGDHFNFDRLDATAFPIAWESDGTPNYLHANAIDEANNFGFKQIGVVLDVEGNSVDMYDANNQRIFFDVTNAPKTLQIKKTDVVVGGGAITTREERGKLVQEFFKKISYVQGNSGKCSKYSWLYAFVTTIVYSEANPGMSFVSSLSPKEAAQRVSARFSSVCPGNVSLYRWIKPGTIQPPIVVTAREVAEVTCDTVVHEGSHALSVNHYFDVAGTTKTTDGSVKPFFDYCFTANKWLRLYLFDDFVPNIASSFDDKKICIEDFKTSATRTLFDEIIDQGMSTAIENFIDTKIFLNGRPPHWTPAEYKKSGAQMPIADLVIWISMNDLVKFTQYATNNIMDYVLSTKLFENPQNHEAYFKRRIVRFSRFQWELARKTLNRMGELVFSV